MSQTTLSATQPNRWLQRTVLGLLVAVILFALAGALYQSLSERRDRRAYPMPGELIDVGGYKLHIDCTGQGSPTVILDSGLGDTYISWRTVQPQFARVCSYDRAGLGYSDSSPHPRTSKNIAEELHTLLHHAGVPPPYILVGHSMGGFDVRLYASLYRNEVAGLVLVDSSHPEQRKRLPPALLDLDASWVRQQEFLEFTMPFGIPRLLGFCDSDPEVRAAECNFHSAREAVAELKSISESAAQTAATGPLGDLLLAVLSSDPEHPRPDLPEDLIKPTNDAWQQMQEELSHLSTKGTRVVAKGSGHYIQIDRPEVVIEAVHNLVDQARQSQDTPPH
ncbi:MAG TPA: alpha/beta hydrolase [Candidatus Dormibacteraeota bacterium]|nr:alpha/beta hydrolase [Candidatus Dormibacteraeota bacterium]